MKTLVKAGTTSKIVRVRIQDSTTGNGKTGLAYNTSGLKFSYSRDNQSTVTVVSLANATIGTYTSGGFKEVDATNWPGLYEFGVPNNMLLSGTSGHGLFFGVSGMVECPLEIQITAVDVDSATNFVASVPAVANIVAQTGDAYLRIGLNGAGLTAIGDARMAYLDASVNSRHPSGASVAGVLGNVGGSVAGSVASVVDKTGFKLASDGVDAISIETGVNMRQAIAAQCAWHGGDTDGFTTDTITFRAINNPATSRIIVDMSSGDREITLNLPA